MHILLIKLKKTNILDPSACGRVVLTHGRFSHINVRKPTFKNKPVFQKPEMHGNYWLVCCLLKCTVIIGQFVVCY